VINGNKFDIPGIAISPIANPSFDGFVTGIIGGGVNRAVWGK
jgi:hypothetical protein